MNEPITRVYFGKDKEGEITAFFPDLPGNGDPETMLCYFNAGQHGHAGDDYMLECGKACTGRFIGNAAALINELQAMGYKLHVMKRVNRNTGYNNRVRALNRLK